MVFVCVCVLRVPVFGDVVDDDDDDDDRQCMLRMYTMYLYIYIYICYTWVSSFEGTSFLVVHREPNCGITICWGSP